MFGRRRHPVRMDSNAPVGAVARDIVGTASMTLTPAGVLVDGWTPTELSNKTVWCQPGGLTAGGFTWVNSGTSGNFTEATNKPDATTINSIAAADFNATNDTCTDGTWANVTGNTWFSCGVFRLDSDRTSATVKDGTACPLIGSSAGGGGIYVYYDGSVMKLFAHQYNNAQGDRVTPTADAQTTVSTGGAHYWEASLNGGTLSCRLDGNTEQTLAVTADQQNTNGNCELGFHAARSLTGLDGAIAEPIYATSIPSAANLAAIRRYMATVYGVTTP